MSTSRRYRFGAICIGPHSGGSLAELARRLEGEGFDTLLAADHYMPDPMSCGPLLVAAANATTTLRVGSLVYNNGFRHPALLAKEAATIGVPRDPEASPTASAHANCRWRPTHAASGSPNGRYCWNCPAVTARWRRQRRRVRACVARLPGSIARTCDRHDRSHRRWAGAEHARLGCPLLGRSCLSR
jgi:luciferase-like monooxygenase